MLARPGGYILSSFMYFFFHVECYLTACCLGQASNHLLIVRWVLIASAITATLVIAVFILIWSVFHHVEIWFTIG